MPIFLNTIGGVIPLGVLVMIDLVIVLGIFNVTTNNYWLLHVLSYETYTVYYSTVHLNNKENKEI